MKIVNLCLTSPYSIGWGYQDNLLAKYQKKNGNEVVIITTQYFYDDKGNIHTTHKLQEIDNDIRVIRLKTAHIKLINKILRHYEGLYENLIKEKPDVIFIHNLQFVDIYYVCKYLNKHPNVKCFVDGHADYTNTAKTIPAKMLNKTLWRYCAKKINKYTQKFFGVIPVRCDFLVDMYKVPKEKVELLVMGADDEFVASSKNRRKITREEYGIKDDDFLIFTGGKIDKYKKDTIDLMRTIKEMKNDNIKLIIFGTIDPSYKNEFESNLNKNIKYVGWLSQEKIYDLICASDLGCFPGRHSVLWEQTVACGIPAIFKDISNTKHVDIGGNCVFIKDVSQLKSAILSTLNMDNYIKMNKVAKSSKKEDFLYSNIAKRSIEC